VRGGPSISAPTAGTTISSSCRSPTPWGPKIWSPSGTRPERRGRCPGCPDAARSAADGGLGAAVAPSRAMSGRSRSLQPPSALASLRARGALVALLGGGMLAVVGTTPGCGASGGAPAKAAWGTAECRSQVLRLPAEPLVVEMRGALRCRRDHVFEDERE